LWAGGLVFGLVDKGGFSFCYLLWLQGDGNEFVLSLYGFVRVSFEFVRVCMGCMGFLVVDFFVSLILLI